jgi:hypothetical protein
MQSLVDYDENSNFVPDGDKLTFKRSFHSIFHAERSARHFQHQKFSAARKTQSIVVYFEKSNFVAD